MDTVPQDAFATLELSEEGGEGLTGLARVLLEAGVNEMMAAQADAMCEETGTARNGFRERRLSRRRSARSRPGYRSCAGAPTSRTASSSGGAGRAAP